MSKTQKNVEYDESKIKEYANEFARFIVLLEGSKIPIKRDDIIKHLKDTFGFDRTYYSKIVEAAEIILKTVYGYKLVEAVKNVYIVVLNERCEEHEDIYEIELRTLLIAALTHIFMSGGSVTEVNMKNFLSAAELITKSEDDTNKILSKTFKEQLYLEYKEPETEGGEYKYQWGLRAEREVSKMSLLENMAKAFQKDKQFWPEQLKMAKEQHIQLGLN